MGSVNLFAADILFLAPYVETASAAFYPEVSQGFIGVLKQKESAREFTIIDSNHTIFSTGRLKKFLKTTPDLI